MLIQVKTQTAKKLKARRIAERECYDEIIVRLLDSEEERGVKNSKENN